MQFIIYPGLQKTGTSYFQLFCKSNRALLKDKYKISYLSLEQIFPDWPRSEHYSSNHNKIASYFADYSSSFKAVTRDELQRLEQIIANELKEHHVVLCAEDFSRQINLELLSSFCTKILGKTSANLIVSFVLREPKTWAQSMFNQYNKQRLLNFVQDGKAVGELNLTAQGMAKFLKQQAYFRLLNQTDLISHWKKSFNAEIEVLSYEDICRSTYSLPIEILCRVTPDLDKELIVLEEKLILPPKANTNISNNWLDILYGIASNHDNKTDAKRAIRQIIEDNCNKLINLSGSTSINGIHTIDDKLFNIQDYFKSSQYIQ